MIFQARTNNKIIYKITDKIGTYYFTIQDSSNSTGKPNKIIFYKESEISPTLRFEIAEVNCFSQYSQWAQNFLNNRFIKK